jgi:hypothetical protein
MKDNPHLEIHTKESVSSFLTLCEQIKKAEVKSGNKADFLFRGQSTDEPLIPKIARIKPKGGLQKVEHLMMDEFERQRLTFTEFEPKNEWDLLALAQHHGLPTRLLDWSRSALAALWFSVKNPPKKNDEGLTLNGVVWLLKTKLDDFIEFPTKESPYRPAKTRIFRPRSVSRRILVQAGLFTCHRRLPTGKFIALEKNSDYKERLVKIVIPANSFHRIRDQLDACGVNSVSLFPDLDGLAAHLRFRYFRDAKAKVRFRNSPKAI